MGPFKCGSFFLYSPYLLPLDNALLSFFFVYCICYLTYNLMRKSKKKKSWMVSLLNTFLDPYVSISKIVELTLEYEIWKTDRTALVFGCSSYSKEFHIFTFNYMLFNFSRYEPLSALCS